MSEVREGLKALSERNNRLNESILRLLSKEKPRELANPDVLRLVVWIEGRRETISDLWSRIGELEAQVTSAERMLEIAYQRQYDLMTDLHKRLEDAP